MTPVRPVALIGAFILCACADPTVPTPTLTRQGGTAFVEGDQQFIIVGQNGVLPAGLAERIADAGGTLAWSIDDLGAAVATSSNPGFAAAVTGLPGLTSVTPDQVLEFTLPRIHESDLAALSHEVGAHEPFRAAEWHLDAVHAPAAWAAGYTGVGARVAVVDGGLFVNHPDLVGQIDIPRSRSFTTGGFNTDLGTFWHGTHVAGIIAANDNNTGVVGIAPGAKLIGVKVLHGGTGNFGALLSAVDYASRSIAAGGAGAHVINMSLGSYTVKNGPANAHFVNLVDKTLQLARKRGVLVIAAAGNDAVDLDHPFRSESPIPGVEVLPANVLSYPAESRSVINVSATAPIGFWNGGGLDFPASYTNFGQSAITLAAPGGDFMLPGNAPCTVPNVGTVPCWVLDGVFSTTRTGWAWSTGTSMAAPAVAAVAALVIDKNDGPMDPVKLEGILRKTADDLGKSGKDDFYGHGRVNAARAVGAQP